MSDNIDKNAVIYIHDKDYGKNYGFVLEITREHAKEEKYQNIVDEFIHDMRSESFKDVFDLFWQCGSNDKYDGYNYFESWKNLSASKQDIMLTYIEGFAKAHDILWDVTRPKDFPI